jgi:hypothetical protein
MKVEIEINSCRECKHFKEGNRQSTDGWDEGFDWFCKKMEDKKIAGFVECDDKPKIPTWCPIAPPEETKKPLTQMERLNIWVNNLDDYQLRALVPVLVELLIDFEEVSFSDYLVSPIWAHTGECIDDNERID